MSSAVKEPFLHRVAATLSGREFQQQWHTACSDQGPDAMWALLNGTVRQLAQHDFRREAARARSKPPDTHHAAQQRLQLGLRHRQLKQLDTNTGSSGALH